MPSPVRSFQNRKRNNKENESPKRHNNNIGDLSPVVKANLALNYEYNERKKKIDGAVSPLTEKNSSDRPRPPLKGGDRNKQNKQTNKTEAYSYHPDHHSHSNHHHSDHRSAALELQITQSKPLSSTRDPRRRQLQSRLPFAPFSHGTFHENGNGRQYRNKKGGKRSRNTKRNRSKTNGQKTLVFDKKEITPAYAYKNAQTGLLEISIHPPNSRDIDLVEGGSSSQSMIKSGSVSGSGYTPALYPIAINGGGIGVYTDPREFAKGGINTMSQNRHETTNAPTRSFISFPWNMGDGTYSSEKKKRELEMTIADNEDDDEHANDMYSEIDDTLDLEAGLSEVLQPEMINDENGDKIFHPWKTWEKVHNFVVQVKERHSNIHIGNGNGNSSNFDICQSSPSSPAPLHFHKPFKQKRKARVSSVYNCDDFDFAIVLQPKEVYSYWAAILDFREENGISTDSSLEDNDELYTYSTPDRGSRKRRRRGPQHYYDENERDSNSDEEMDLNTRHLEQQQQSFKVSSGHRNISVDKQGRRTFKQGCSLFDRAMAKVTPPRNLRKKRLSPVRSVARQIRKSLSDRQLSPAVSKSTPPSSSRGRRRWGNTVHSATKPSIMSPPIRSLRKKSPKRGNRYNGTPHPDAKSKKDHKHAKDNRDRKRRKTNPNSLDIEDIPNQLIPRGIAARTNGMAEFLWSLERGIVVRRHRPNHDPVFIKLSSADGGDTIHFKYMLPEDAYIAFKSQRVRYNKAPLKGLHDRRNNIEPSAWSEETKDERLSFDREQHNASLPDYVNRSSTGSGAGGLKKNVIDKATKAINSGYFQAHHIIAVTRATHPDPLSPGNEPGTASLRETKNLIRRAHHSLDQHMSIAEKNRLITELEIKEPCDERTFSLVLPGITMMMGGKRSLKLKSANENWHNGIGSEKSFRFLDLEAATSGEYWMLFRGFLLLQRDAMHGRFAAQRASGFGSNYNRRELEQRKEEMKKKGTESVHYEPEEKSWLKKFLLKSKNDDTSAPDYPKPPPSDYFLGFKSNGTQIWSRLRQAGLETKRIYDLDTRVVMIKIRCPSDRLMDVAEVLRIKMKTTDGYFLPFQENLSNQYEGCKGSECQPIRSSNTASIFRSSIRQNIIDFIINSRIRDSGAEMSGQTELGKGIKLRVPMHMHARLEDIYKSWVFFYKEENWNGESMSIDSPKDLYKVPSLIKRLCVGSFFQPLDSIEEYFGERVAFYFAWLQHCSLHLTYLSFLGLILFVCQMVSGTFDHVLRPYFSVVLMIWSFFVMVTWRKRQNFLAHRWGTMNYKQEETTRPQFRGEYKQCEITKEMIVHYPSWKRWLKYCISIPLTVAFTVVSLIGFLIVHANRDLALARYFSEEDKSSIYDFNWSLAAIGEIEAIGAVTLSKENLRDFHFWYTVGAMPCALGLSLPLLNFILMQISRRLNDFENYKTESQYQNALIVKVIAFRFVTYFSALYYYAYIAIGKDTLTMENSILRVATSLVIYLTVAHWWGIFLGIYIPLLVFRWRLYRKGIDLSQELRVLESMETKLKNNEIPVKEKNELSMKIANKTILLEQAQSKIWEEIMLPDYNPFFDYILAVIYFAFVTCFSAILPITPLLVLLNQVINMRLNAYKICRSRRRPLAQKAGGVSTQNCISTILMMITLSNDLHSI